MFVRTFTIVRMLEILSECLSGLLKLHLAVVLLILFIIVADLIQSVLNNKLCCNKLTLNSLQPFPLITWYRL